MLSIVLTIAIIAMMVSVFHRLGNLEQRVNFLTEKLESRTSKSPAPKAAIPKTQVSNFELQPEQRLETQSPGVFEKFLTWLKTDLLMKIGALFLILALAWFVSFSFAQNWIGPVGRISLGILAGAGLLLWGHKLIEKKSIPGQVIVATGMVATLLTVFAAREVYGFFTPTSSLGIMALAVALVAVIAIARKTLPLAVIALIGGAIAPLLTNSPSPDFVSLLSYVFILDLGALAIVALRGWRPLILLSLIITGIYSGAFYEINLSTTWIFMAIFFAMFFFASVSAIWRDKKALFADLVAIVLAVLLAIAWIAEFVPGHMQSLVSAGTAGIVAVLSSLLFRRGAPSAAVLTHSAAAIALLGAATAFELEGESLTIALFLETIALLAVARFGMKDARAVRGVAFLQAIPVLLSLESLDYWRNLGSDFAVILVGAVSLAISALILKNFFAEKESSLPKVFLILSAVFSAGLIWRTLEVLIDSASFAHGAALVIFTLIGIALFFQGSSKEIPTVKNAGLILLGLVTLRLVFVEVWDMSLGGRIITFLLIGALFISTAFFKKENLTK